MFTVNLHNYYHLLLLCLFACINIHKERKIYTQTLNVCCSFLDLKATATCVGVARVGAVTQMIARDSLQEIHHWDLGPPLHSLVVVGRLHPLEERMLALTTNTEPVKDSWKATA